MDFRTHTPHMIAMLKKLVENKSPSHEKAVVDVVGRIIAEECRRMGGQVEIFPRPMVGDIVQARWGTGMWGILLLCHMDTVFPPGTLKKMPFYKEGDRIHGPGVSDMKGGIVVALTALEAVIRSGKMPYPVTALFTSDEEIGSHASRGLIEKLAEFSRVVLVMEPGMIDGSLKTWRKGVGEFTIKVRGRAAHAGSDHEKGRNAIEEIAHQVLAIQKLTDYSQGTTLNVGVVHGGIASNVVPDEARIEVDLRVLQPGEAERITVQIYGLQPVIEGTKIEVTGGLNRPPMPYNEVNQSAFEKARLIAKRLGMTLKASGTGGASDANFIAPLGVPVLDGLGPLGAEYHSEREYIIASSLAERASLLAALLQDW